MKQFLINCSSSQADSTYVVNAVSHEDAARLYVEASFEDQLAEHVEDMEPRGTLRTVALPAPHAEGVQSWQDMQEKQFDLDALIEDYHTAQDAAPEPAL